LVAGPPSPENPTLDWPATVEIRLFGRFVPLNCHWNRSGPPPTTPTLRIRVFPARTVWLAGWLVMIGCACKELVPGTSATTTMSFRVRLFISAESISWPHLQRTICEAYDVTLPRVKHELVPEMLEAKQERAHAGA
jgi:hypothetical protein